VGPVVQAGNQKDIVDTAVAAGSFKTLVTALQAAGLVETLKGKGPFTVFARGRDGEDRRGTLWRGFDELAVQ
jgi:uncharacterized surface protein with fasciclin (FAS1) repeats